ncbi:General stress protein 26 [Brevibacterium siliguriense]|uniref:General stress protein 26 n=1 Tax=Brevibacterium siliguriense TaxID=1136497 RepID=A0A1H1LCV3_9MICO|nr:pyridoxamine 5'-phosphate oxidase family protein [Brevibacterium siliguriense]SDR72378.1 General stress protein 26 [Brevibacterium siliguriense]
MNRDKNTESRGEEKARDAAAVLDETTEKFAGTSNIAPGEKGGYNEEDVEARAKDVAASQGANLYRNPDGSHTAVDESASVIGTDPDLSAGRTRRRTAASDDLDQKEVIRILRGSGYVMLTTALDDGKLLAHPMVPQQVTDDADIWFFIGLDGDQAKALKHNPNVNVTVSEAGNWLSVAGRIDFVDDQSKRDELWNDDAATWFDGRDDSTLGLIKVTSDSAQHWGLKGGKVAGLVQIVKAKVTGQRPDSGSSTTEL